MSEIELHRKLLGDGLRNQALLAALKKTIQPGKSTLTDIGAGTGFISFIARQLGAKQCTLIEYSDTLALARELAHVNKINGLHFVQAHSAEIKKPPKTDIVVSETLGNFALEEGLLETLVDARRFLSADGVMIPCGLRQFVAPVFASRLQDEIDVWPRVGFGLKLTPAREASLNNMYVKPIVPADLGSDDAHACEWDRITFGPGPDSAQPSSLRSATLRWNNQELGATVLHGFALWWICELVPSIVISTSPFAPATHWEQVYLPLLEPLRLKLGDEVELTLTSDTRPKTGLRVAWKTRLLLDGRAVSTQAQDISRGRI